MERSNVVFARDNLAKKGSKCGPSGLRYRMIQSDMAFFADANFTNVDIQAHDKSSGGHWIFDVST